MILADRWSSLEELLAAHRPLRLDLGCGWVKEPGYVGLDVFLALNADPYPFADGSVAEVRSRHFLEHSLLDHVFHEAYRLLRPGGRFVAIVPYANSADGMAPGHNVFLTERFFERNPSFQAKFAV